MHPTEITCYAVCSFTVPGKYFEAIGEVNEMCLLCIPAKFWWGGTDVRHRLLQHTKGCHRLVPGQTGQYTSLPQQYYARPVQQTDHADTMTFICSQREQG